MKTTQPFLFLAFLFFSFPLFAQFSIGVKGGYIKAWQEYGDVGLPEDAKIHINGFHVSALAYFELNHFLSAGLEPGYTRRGAACLPGFIVFNQDAKLMLNYMEMPLLISARFPVYQDKLEVFAKAGYGFSKIMSGYQENTAIGSGEPPVRSELDFDNPFGINVDRWDEGIHGGLGVSYNVGNHQLFLESKLYYGLKDVDTNNKSENRSINLGVGYLFRI